MGNGNVPNTSTCLLASATTTMPALDSATIFSRKRAPPPPLIRCKFESNSSAPSITKSKAEQSVQSTSGIPCSIDNFSVTSDVGIPAISNPSSRILLPNSRMVYLTVEPVPIPIIIPSFTKLQAAIPASAFIASFSSAENSPMKCSQTIQGISFRTMVKSNPPL